MQQVFFDFFQALGYERCMFGKKKEKTVESDKGPDLKKTAEKKSSAPGESPVTRGPSPRSLKFRKRLKYIIIAMLVLCVLVGGGFAGYTFFLNKETGRHYVEKELAHITLPPEMMKFCFQNLPDLFDEFQRFSLEMTRLDREIQRIEAIAAAYPDQSSIADKEKKIWTSARTRSLKNFEKIESRVRQIYVTFQINLETGTTRLDQERPELLQQTTEIIKPILALTDRIKTTGQPPDGGWVKKTIYKIKHLFI
ncbi:hypothetical protein HRM2_21860 [Desulforapulum autotrophicum HRM2]|uniref:Uncharacterized protein n=1 Tax=Desulforapulum autotrophicum (strain ATCC 43914 / DSM 3382 / VKM B-1955 / HRM2) TaxID=177437 RepID=C0QDM0_DESAH|nr:hypothetical protein [Desulforapulum autotrophicum]ACN15284.1 hypothetical protein HRM2_21860 [Desulforapulum autotrophicum HRM2]